MKIILSRKGFDSSNGGCASPIFPDGRMISLPIPASNAPTKFNDVQFGETNLGQIVMDLTKEKILSGSPTHLDPDLNQEALHRKACWLPAFGQTGSAQSHLSAQEVGVGDLFLFFGWFKRVEKTGCGHWRFVPGSSDLHVIFGWLQVGEVLQVGAKTKEFSEKYPWLARHPHLHGERSINNTIYVAREYLDLPGLPQLRELPGAGVFDDFSEHRRLTAPCQPSRSVWRLPAFFLPSEDGRSLTYHADPARWKPVEDGWVQLQSVAKGQEFVHDCKNHPEEKKIESWIASLY